MAIIKISGTVDRIFQDGKCVKVTETSTKGDKTYTDRYTAWFEQSPGLTEGQQVNISGFLSVKQGKPWEDRDGNQRTSIDVNVNRARVDGDQNGNDQGATGAPARQDAPQGEPWNQPAPDASQGDVWADQNTPF